MTMLTKLFAPSKIKPSSFMKPAAASASAQPPPTPPPPDDCQMPLRIIHAGGFVECYYMAVPAVGIMEKYPRSILARPDVFHRPWESLVCPEEILTPGQKFYVVPRRTVRKLRQRIQRPSVCHLASREKESDSEFSSKSSHFRFADREPEGNTSMSSEGNTTGRSAAPRRPPRRRRAQFAEMWRPSLVAIDESSPLAAPPLPLPSEILS